MSSFNIPKGVKITVENLLDEVNIIASYTELDDKAIIFNKEANCLRIYDHALGDFKNLNNVLEETLDSILNIIKIAPTYTLPSLSITNFVQVVEKGSTIAPLELDLTYTQNDGGNVISYLYEKDNLQIATGQVLVTTITNITTTIELKGTVEYEEGLVKNNNLGIADPDGKILAGQVKTSRNLIPRLRIWSKALASVPTNSAEIRAIGNSFAEWDNQNSVTIQTGTSFINFIVAVPSSKTTATELVAQDTSNNIALTYMYNSTILLDLGTGTEEYRLYTLTIGNAYPSSATHIITL